METMRFNRAMPLAGLFVTLCVIVFMAAGASKAGAVEKPFNVDFDSSEISVSLLKDLPLDTLSSDASIKGTIDGSGNVSIPSGGFKMPELGLTEPVAIKGFMGIEGPTKGTYDAASGKLEIDGKAGIWVSVNIKDALALANSAGLDLTSQLSSFGPLIGLLGSDLTCGFSPMDIHFSTETSSLATGQRFTNGPLGAGAISAEWSQFGPFSGRRKILGFDPCILIKDALPGLLEGLVGDTGTGTGTGGIDLGSLLDGIDLGQLDDLDLGPSSITLTRTLDQNPIVGPPGEKTDPAPAKLKLKVSPKNRGARAGSLVRYVASVTNVGGTKAGNARVCLKAPRGAAKKPSRCQKLGSIAKGKSKKRTFVLKLKKTAVRRSYRITFRIRSGTRVKPSTSALLRIR